MLGLRVKIILEIWLCCAIEHVASLGIGSDGEFAEVLASHIKTGNGP